MLRNHFSKEVKAGCLLILFILGLRLIVFLPQGDFCLLLSLLLMFLGSLYCKQYGPRSDCSLGSKLIGVHSVCFFDKIKSEVHLDICSRRKKQTTFL